MTNNIYEELIRINKELGRKPKYDGILMHSMDARQLQETDSPWRGIQGTPIFESPFIKPGEYGLIPHQETAWKPTKPEVPPIEFDFLSFNQGFYRISGFWPFVYNPFEKNVPPYHWQRYMNEALLKWGSRLFERNLLDDPEIRWEYQKAILSAPVKWANKLFGR